MPIPKIKITYSRTKYDQVIVTGSEIAAKELRANWQEDMNLRESFNIILLDRANKILGMGEVSKGGVCGTLVDEKIIFGTAFAALASNIILAHNHPSGNLKPSPQDFAVTKRLVEIGKITGIQILDHIILSPCGGYYSFGDNGDL